MNFRIKTLIVGIVFLASTLACVTVTKIFSPQATVSYPPTFVPTETPFIAPPTQTETPTALASCPATLTDIIIAATSVADVKQTANISQEKTRIVTYEVTGNQIVNPFYNPVPSDLQDEQNDAATQGEVWSYFTALIPENQRDFLAKYTIMTDGQNNLLAAVSQTNYDPSLWALEVDIADIADRANLTYTFIHEFGHLLTLNPAQVPPSIAVFDNPDDKDIYSREIAACPNYFPGEGCSQSGSYINIFYNQFWVNIHDEWQQIDQINDEDKYYEELDNFYFAHHDQFVTDYAVTNPEEDIAESWSFFILSPKPTGDTIAEQKTLFFYAFPELAQLRNEILTNLCNVYQ